MSALQTRMLTRVCCLTAMPYNMVARSSGLFLRLVLSCNIFLLTAILIHVKQDARQPDVAYPRRRFIPLVSDSESEISRKLRHLGDIDGIQEMVGDQLPGPMAVQPQAVKASAKEDILTAPVFNYKRAHPYATDPFDPNPMIYMTSVTELQPLNWQWIPEGSDYFERHCPNLQSWMKCHYTQRSTDAEINRSHAILFHTRHMFVSKGVRSFQGLPSIRHQHQKWVFYEPEAPTNTWNYANISAPYWTLFNVTATFTMDSDIPVQHHKMICKPRPNWKPTGVNYAKNKKLAAWFVSHCTCSSKREVYVQEMMKYMKIDVYGDCGNTSVCNRNAKKPGEDPDACMVDLLTREYKFYLSFENAFCTHYVTEKFHRMIQMVDVIPVVMGAADYINILPQGSYIDFRDFKSPRQLAKFLLKLNRNDKLYNSYIERKKSYDCTPMLPFGCNICEYLHNHRYETQLVYDAASFWSVEQRCTDPKDFFRGFANNIIPRINYNITPSLFL